jgi:hypothetical protein
MSTPENKNFINLFGKVATFPKPILPSKAYKYLETIKINKNKLWYILIQQQNDQLQMIKYNNKAGVNLIEFIFSLIEYYESVYHDDKMKQLFKNIEVVGEDAFVTIKNIPSVKIDNKPLVSLIATDLIKLLRDSDEENN